MNGCVCDVLKYDRGGFFSANKHSGGSFLNLNITNYDIFSENDILTLIL